MSSRTIRTDRPRSEVPTSFECTPVQSRRRPSSRRRLLALVLLAGSLVLALGAGGCGSSQRHTPKPPPIDGEPTPPTPNPPTPGQTPLEQAGALYQSGAFQEAASVLEAYLGRSEVSRDDRLEALEHLAMSFAALGDTARTRLTVQRLLDRDESYEIPINRVPPTLARIYLGVLDARGLLQETPSGVKTVAVVDFDNASLTNFEEVAGLGKGLASLLVSELIQATDATHVRVVERMKLDYVLKEHEMSRSDLVDPDTAIRVGKLLGAQSFVFGSYIRNGEELTIVPRIVVTETGRLVESFRRDGTMADIGGLVHEVADQIVEELGELAKRRPVRHVSTEAIQAFTQGEDLLRDGDLEQALASFQRARSLSPGWNDADEKIRMLRPLVAPVGIGQSS
ncbi:MAG: CsgG/HfaB family protein [Candidatus Eiseniibacteriota bacterium]|jgi:TolB-like protein